MTHGAILAPHCLLDKHREVWLQTLAEYLADHWSRATVEVGGNILSYTVANTANRYRQTHLTSRRSHCIVRTIQDLGRGYIDIVMERLVECRRQLVLARLPNRCHPACGMRTLRTTLRTTTAHTAHYNCANSVAHTAHHYCALTALGPISPRIAANISMARW